MDAIIKFAQNITPLGVIAILALVLWRQAGGIEIISRIRGTQVQNKKDDIDYKLLATNHLHEIPEMKITMDRIEKSVNEIGKELNVQGNRLTRVETKLEK